MIYLYGFLIIFIFIWTIVIFLLLSSIAGILFSKVPYCPTPNVALDEIIKELKIQPNQIIYDLGCGDGRFLFAAEKFGAKTFGYEISLPSYLRAQFYIKKRRLKTKIYFKNFYKANLNNADVVFCFLTKRVIGEVEKLLINNLKKGATVVVYTDVFSSLKPFKTMGGKNFAGNINFYKI